MSAAPQAPAPLPLKKGIVKQVSEEIINFVFLWHVPTQQLKIEPKHVFSSTIIVHLS